MIFVVLGSNLPSGTYGSSKETLESALHSFIDWGIEVNRVSSWYKSAPLPLSDQPWYINAVAQVNSLLSPHDLIATLLQIEETYGRSRTKKNEARVIDLDLLTYNTVIVNGIIKNGIKAFIPHPRMIERSFVLKPIYELCPNWIHPQSGDTIDNLVRNLPIGQCATPLIDNN